MRRRLTLLLAVLVPAIADAQGIDYRTAGMGSWADYTRGRYILCHDFSQSNLSQPFSVTAITGGTIGNGGSLNHQVYLIPTAAAGANSGAFVGTAAFVAVQSGMEFQAIIQPKNLTNTNFYSGLHNTLTVSAPTNGVYFNSVAGLMTGKAVKASGGTTTTATNYQLLIDTWYRLRIVISATAATFTIYADGPAGAALWTDTVAATNIPGVTELVGVTTATFHTAGSAGTALSWIDWQCAEVPVSR